MKTFYQINRLLKYAQKYLGLHPDDVTLKANAIVDILGLPTFEFEKVEYVPDDVHQLLQEFCQTAVEEGVFEAPHSAYYCDKIMGELTLLPSTFGQVFWQIYKDNGAKVATDWLYSYAVANNYVKKAVLDKNIRFDSNGLVVTINLAKPEFRDPKKAVAGNSIKGGYPKCVICRQNEGYASLNKCTLRTLPITLGGQGWFWQYSPFGYFREHGIAVNCQHTPMKVDHQTFVNLLDFIDQFPHYFIGCNAALARIGGSVLAHDHYQGGGEILPMHKVGFRKYLKLKGYDDLTIGIVDWYNTAVRICGTDRNRIVEVCDLINDAWRSYTNTNLQIVANSNGEQHNAVSPTVVKKGNEYQMTLILRSNVTNEQYPDGIFHAHPEYHVIKKESIGLIEAQGLFILPGRLQKQLGDLAECIVNGKLSEDLAEFQLVYDETVAIMQKGVGDVQTAIELELGSICKRILHNTAVFKTDDLTVAFLQQLGFEVK